MDLEAGMNRTRINDGERSEETREMVKKCDVAGWASSSPAGSGRKRSN